MAETNLCRFWKPFLTMVAVDFGLAVVNIFLKKVMSEGMHHLVIVTYRQTVSAIFLTPVAFFWERKSRPKLTAHILCQLFFSALLGATLTQYFFLLGLRYTSATYTCAFINMVPVNTFIMALPFGLEKVNMSSNGGRAKVLGSLVCIGGALLLTLYKGAPLMSSATESQALTRNRNNNSTTMISAEKTQNWAVGSILLIAGSLVWSSWFLIQARIGKKYPCQYSSTAITSLFSAIQSATLSLIADRNISIWVLKGKLEITSVVYAGMVGSGLCYVGMAWCVKKRGPVFTSAFCPFIQIFVAIFDFSILREQIHLGSVLGSVLVIAGLYILLWGKSNETEDFVVKQTEEENCNPASQIIPVSTVNSTSP